MSVLETVKNKLISEKKHPLYRCENCGQEFRTAQDPDSYWARCRECDGQDLELIDERLTDERQSA